MADEASKDKEIRDLLMREYTMLKQEALAVMGYYKGHIRNFQLLLGAIVSVSGLILAGTIPPPALSNWLLWWFVATALWIVVQYLVFDLWEAQYHLSLIGEQLSTIEERLNISLNQRLFIWETSVVPKYWTRFRPFPGLINPDWFLCLWGTMLMFLSALIAPNAAYYVLWKIVAPSGHAVERIMIIAGSFMSLFFSAVAIYVGVRILLGTRGKLRNDFEEMYRQPLRRVPDSDEPFDGAT